MYCRKCGKKIDYDAEMCVECQENEELFVSVEETPVQPAQQPTYTYAQPAAAPAPQDNGSRKYGLALGIAGAIVSEFAVVFAYLMIVLGLASGGMATAIFLPFALGTSIFSLVAGIKSINRYKACSNAGKVRPIPTLILGIISLVGAIAAFLLIFIGFMALLAML